MVSRLISPRLALVLAAALLLIAAQERAGPTFAAEFTVDSTIDAVDATPGDGVCDDGAGNCTLRAAVMETNALPGADSIHLLFGPYTLTIAGTGEDGATTGDLDITDDLTLWGSGAGFVIDGGGIDRVLHTIGSGTELSLISGTVQNGDAGSGDGGGILAEGPLALTDVLVGGFNSAERGGGIAGSNITFMSAGIDANTAAGQGGGIYSTGVLTGTGISMFRNEAGGDGGGIYNAGGSVTVSGGSINENSSGDGGGGVYNASGSIGVSGVTISENSAGGDGGGVYNAAGTLELSFVRVSANEAVDGAGAYNATGATLTIGWSTIDGNTNATELFAGGGLYNAGTAEITDSAITGNRNGIGAGIYNIGSVSLTNVTVSGNVANDIGGGLNNQGDAILTNATISLNNATDGSAVWNDGSASVGNSILEVFPPDDIRPCQGITSLGHNISNRLACGLAGPGDILLDQGQLLLGPLADNDWVTQTHALLAGSPAIDAGDDAACPATDQRLVARPQDGDGDGESRCDIGAYELRAPYPTPTPTPSQLPPTGGQPASGAGVPWLAMLVAGVALGGGGALVAVRRRR